MSQPELFPGMASRDARTEDTMGVRKRARIAFSPIFIEEGHRDVLVLKEADTVTSIALQHSVVCKGFTRPLLLTKPQRGDTA